MKKPAPVPAEAAPPDATTGTLPMPHQGGSYLRLPDGRLVLDGAPKDVFSRVEQMRSIGLDVPATTETLYELRAAGADVPLGALSDAEAADAIVRWLGN